MHCVDFFLRGIFEDMRTLHVFFIHLSVMGRNPPPLPPIKTKLKYVKNTHIFKATTQKIDQHSA